MAESSTNGKEKDEGKDAATPATTTHESGPGDDGTSDGDVDILDRGTTVGRYLVLERLGAGAMGVAYAAYDPKLDRKIALKLLRPQEGRGDQARRTARLEREAQAIAKLSHPNVVGIFDVGVHQGQVFLAMEYLGGGTLRDWLAAEKRPWREIVKMFIEVGHGLAAAHAEGLIHRDFKPDNVLLDKAGTPKVVDFGLVRLTSGIGFSIDPNATEEDDAPFLPIAATVAVALTKTGALAGTPAYMAPEQFLGKGVDARTDQFAFCVALYEALYAERPFAGDTVVTLADSVTSERIREPPKATTVPVWVRKAILRGLAVDRSLRFATIDLFVEALQSDPAIARRRRVVIGASIAIVLAGSVATQRALSVRRREVEREIAADTTKADAAFEQSALKRAEAQQMRVQAFAAFDNARRTEGEELWATSLQSGSAADTAAEQGIKHLDAAVSLSPNRTLRGRLADAILNRLKASSHTAVEQTALLQRLALVDEGGQRAQELKTPATLQLISVPAGLAVHLEKYDPTTLRLSTEPRNIGRTPVSVTLEPGSYRLSIDATQTRVGFYYPVLLAAGAAVTVSLSVPLRSEVPEGFIFVPSGRFLFGESDESLRASFLDTVPIHENHVDAFLISRDETTFREWIEFLEDLPLDERTKRIPRVRAPQGSIELREAKPGQWELALQPTTNTFVSTKGGVATEGGMIRYPDRTRRASQDWRRFPVSGVSANDAETYLKWLRQKGRVNGARLCTEKEWERAARGADDRVFPHGNQLLPDDANIDITYSRKPLAFGPDAVGSHPISDSPFGVRDLCGNIIEMTTGTIDGSPVIARGGAYYYDQRSARVTNREPMDPSLRFPTLGLRVCANVQQPTQFRGMP
jgi:formylglycine-generating enzyme required for sulfatase activity